MPDAARAFARSLLPAEVAVRDRRSIPWNERAQRGWRTRVVEIVRGTPRTRRITRRPG